MLIPQFSIRWLLAVAALCAGVFSVVGLGVRGHGWAIAVSVAFAALAILMLVYGALFGLAWLCGGTSDRGRRNAEQGTESTRV